MKPIRLFAIMPWLICASPCGLAADEAVLKELAPTGTIRVAIAVGPAPSGIYMLKDASTRGYKGVTIDLSEALSRKLGLPVTYVPFLGSGDIQNSAAAGTWDVTFMPVDDERRKFVDFGSSYHLLQSTYIVAPGSKIASLADANVHGVRIAGVKDTATFRASNRAAPSATHFAVGGVDEAIEMMRVGKIDAIALGRASLGGLVARIAGARILDESFMNSTTAVAVPKGRPLALAYLTTFIEEVKASGLVRRAFDDIGLKAEQVAPPNK